MAQDKPLTIPAPETGISSSPLKGFSDCRNLDISTIPGVARLNNLLAKKSASTVTNLVLWYALDPVTAGQVFALDLGGQVYKSTDSGSTWATVAGETAGGAGQGMTIWKNYLFVARTTTLDVYGPLNAGSAWTNSWKTIDSDVTWHPMIVSYNDNKLYGGAGRYVFSVDEVTAMTFAPGTAGTFVFTQQALDLLLPNYRIKCMAELGNDLMMGTWMGTSITEFKIADLFSWDRSSPSFGTPLRMAENGINSLININSSLFIQAGLEGKIYQSNGVSATLVAQIPSSVANLEGGKYLEPLPGAVANYKGRYFFGLSTGASNVVDGMGVWSLQQTVKGNIITLEHLISTGADGSSSVVKIGALLPVSRDEILVSFRDGAVFGIDKTNNVLRYTSGYFLSPFYTVGTNLIKKQFQQLEFQLSEALTTGQSITIAYRTDLSASFTTIGTYTFASLGAILSHNVIADIPSCEQIQLKVTLGTGATNTSVKIKSVTLR